MYLKKMFITKLIIKHRLLMKITTAANWISKDCVIILKNSKITMNCHKYQAFNTIMKPPIIE